MGFWSCPRRLFARFIPNLGVPVVLKLKPKSASSNKPPQGEPPEKNLFVNFRSFPSNKEIWWSYPQPDKLTLRGLLKAEHFSHHTDKAPIDLNARVISFAEELSGYHISSTGKAAFLGKGDQRKVFEAMLPAGERGSGVAVLIEKIPATEFKAVQYFMRLEMNPRKLGPEGCNHLQFIMHQAGDGGPFDFAGYLAGAWVTRLDVAIDYSDLFPADLILTAEKSGKRVEYFGGDGILETVMLFKTKPPQKEPVKTISNPLGKLIAKVYDRNRERLAHGKSAPYPGRQITRLELVWTRNKTDYGLIQLASMKNPFSKVRLSYAPGMVKTGHRTAWARYLATRRSLGPDVVKAVAGKMSAVI
jgi:hypothetical protein